MATASSIWRHWSRRWLRPGASRSWYRSCWPTMRPALQPIAEVVRLARAAGALVHCDAVQAAGKVPVDVHPGSVSTISASPLTRSVVRPVSAR